MFSSTSHNYEISFATKGDLKISTVLYGKGAFITMATKTLNNIQRQIKDPMINSFPQIDLMLSL